MMKRLGFLETKRTPRYSLRKFSVGVASVLLGVTIFGINFTNHSVKAAATTESVEKSKQPSTVVLPTAERTNTQKATSAATANNPTEAATTPQSSPETQDSASNNATANNSTEAATTSQSAQKTQGGADTDIKSLAARLAATSLVAMQNNKPANEKQVATEDKINWGAIKYKISDDDNSRGVEITGWDITQGGYDVVLPNTADFVKRGTITEKQAAYVSRDDLHNIFLTLASTKTLSFAINSTKDHWY